MVPVSDDIIARCSLDRGKREGTLTERPDRQVDREGR
jgi:hypothetical protein